MLDIPHLAALQDTATRLWHGAGMPDTPGEGTIDRLVLEQHRANFDLWHQEDAARDPLAGDHAIADVKHAIDTLNQRRNDLMERIDSRLFAEVQQNACAPLHSETPGLIVDRLSILALKIFHTEEQALREDATEEHRARNGERLQILSQQRGDLVQCLAELWEDVSAGRRRFKLYRQMKMYNDPTLNPVLYSTHKSSQPELGADLSSERIPLAGD